MLTDGATAVALLGLGAGGRPRGAQHEDARAHALWEWFWRLPGPLAARSGTREGRAGDSFGFVVAARPLACAAVGTPWDARTYDQSSEPQQAWAAEVVARLGGVAQDATVLDVGCGTGRVTEALLGLVPRGRVLAMDASAEMVALARRRLGDRAVVWCEDVLDLDLDERVDAIVSTATLHWVADHDRVWARLAGALRPGGVLEVQCGGEGNLAGVRGVVEAVARDAAGELVDWSPWVFAGPAETERRLREAGFTAIRCWLEDRPTYPKDVEAYVRTSILAAHLARLSEERRERFAAAVVAGVCLPLDHVRLNASAVRGPV